jgi:hypothetical protein
MRPFALQSAASALALVFCSCADQRLGGNTTQTENTAAARVIRVDSILPEWNAPGNGATIATLRLDSFNFDFSQSDSSARDLAIETKDKRPVPFEVVYWDKFARLGRLHVRLDSSLLRPNSEFVFLWNQPLLSLSNPTEVWRALPDSQKLELTSVSVADFENRSATTLLPTQPSWITGRSDSAKIDSLEFKSAGAGRSGNALTIGYSITGKLSYVVVKTPLTFDEQQRNIRSMDSLVFWTRGTKGAGYFIAFDHKELFKAWMLDTLDTVWTRVRIRPSDLIPASNSNGGNKGWEAVRDSTTHLSFIVTGGTRFWLDSVRIYGINQDDLR